MTPPQPITKAKSRLPTQAATHKTVVLTPLTTPQRERDLPQQRRHIALKADHTSNNWVYSFVRKRTRTLPLLLVSVLSFCSLLYILINISPKSIANILFYQSYLPLLALFSLAATTLTIYLCNHTRRGLLLGLFLSLMLFFKLQEVILTPTTILFPAAMLLCIECIFSFIFKK